MSTNIDSFPNMLFFNGDNTGIFSHLNEPQRIAIQRVCKQWFKLINADHASQLLMANKTIYSKALYLMEKLKQREEEIQKKLPNNDKILQPNIFDKHYLDCYYALVNNYNFIYTNPYYKMDPEESFQLKHRMFYLQSMLECMPLINEFLKIPQLQDLECWGEIENMQMRFAKVASILKVHSK